MKLIVGLGNPGKKYQNNRHNVGFMFLDYFVKELTGCRVNELEKQFKFDTHLSSIIHIQFSTLNHLPSLILAKPQTFMNKSGEAVKKLVKQYLNYNLQSATNNQEIVNNFIIIHDDLDIPFGKFRIVKGYGPKLHNGVESIQNHLHTMDFERIRIGVDNRNSENRIAGIDYVLQNFTQEEQSQLPILFDRIIELMKIEKTIGLV